MSEKRSCAAREVTRSGAKVSTLLLCAALALCGCDGGGGETPELPPPAGDAGGSATATYDLEGCVVSVLGTDCSSGLPVPHQIDLLNAKTGELLPGFSTMSASGGRYSFKGVPRDVELAIHAHGTGAAETPASTYDSMVIYAPNAGDNLLRVSSVGTANTVADIGGFMPAQDRVPLSGAVYAVNESGRRVGIVGCAQVFVDDQPHPAATYDQRYNASNGLPTRPERLDRTLAGSGRFYFANLSKGEHTLKVSMDGGKSFILERKVLISKVRADASSPFKSLLYLIGLDIPGPNPTPANCPSEEGM
jgi:hypothetical protein